MWEPWQARHHKQLHLLLWVQNGSSQAPIEVLSTQLGWAGQSLQVLLNLADLVRSNNIPWLLHSKMEIHKYIQLMQPFKTQWVVPNISLLSSFIQNIQRQIFMTCTWHSSRWCYSARIVTIRLNILLFRLIKFVMLITYTPPIKDKIPRQLNPGICVQKVKKQIFNFL